jgi:hypothetical protein
MMHGLTNLKFKFAVANFGLQRDSPKFHINFRSSLDNITERKNMYMLRVHAVVEYLYQEKY